MLDWGEKTNNKKTERIIFGQREDVPQEVVEPGIPHYDTKTNRKWWESSFTKQADMKRILIIEYRQQTKSGRNCFVSSRGFPWLLEILDGSFGQRCLRVCSMAPKQDRSTKSVCRNSIPSLTKFSGDAQLHVRARCMTTRKICTTLCNGWDWTALKHRFKSDV